VKGALSSVNAAYLSLALRSLVSHGFSNAGSHLISMAKPNSISPAHDHALRAVELIFHGCIAHTCTQVGVPQQPTNQKAGERLVELRSRRRRGKWLERTFLDGYKAA
jgi:hypothetical protein